jgi:hypothetical protein
MIVDIRIAGHYAIFRHAHDPFGGELILLGPAMAMLQQVAASAPPGAIHVTEDFAAALNAGPVVGRQRTEYVGELSFDMHADSMGLFSLKR